jgi:membrane-associated phospholipid phosphatase
MDIDSQVVTYIAEHRAWLLDRVALATMFIGTSRGTLAVIGLVGLAIVIWLRKWRMAVAAALALISSALVSELLKDLIGRRRPAPTLALVDAAGSSLPSADAAMTAAVAIAIFLAVDWPTPMVRRIAAVALIVGVFWIGFCVVYLGVHWPTDVLVGWVLGGGIGLAAASRVGRWGRPGRPPATKSTSF